MMSETAFFVKDVVGPLGSASIVAAEAGSRGKSSDVDAHCQTERILLHRSEKNENGELVAKDEYIDLDDEPDHDELCRREQLYFLMGSLIELIFPNIKTVLFGPARLFWQQIIHLGLVKW